MKITTFIFIPLGVHLYILSNPWLHSETFGTKLTWFFSLDIALSSKVVFCSEQKEYCRITKKELILTGP